jgi:intraflagellar transport protein 52
MPESDDTAKKSISFNVTKKETHHPSDGYKKLFRRLRSQFKVTTNKDELTADTLAAADVHVFGGPKDPFEEYEVEDLKKYLDNGGRAIICFQDSGEKAHGSNFKNLLSDYGITVNDDSVMRSVYYKYLHPKEVFIEEGVLVPDFLRKKNSVVLSNRKSTIKKQDLLSDTVPISDDDQRLAMVYPYGVSLNIARPARPILSSGPVSFPMNRPIAAMWESETVGGDMNQRGRLLVLGSAEIFGDDWLDKEENSKVCDMLFSWLLNEAEFEMSSDRQDSELSDYHPVPHIESISTSIKPCLQDLDELPRDFTRLFDTVMMKFDTNLIPETLKCYNALGVPHEPLTLIPPQFECPLPKLNPATFPPAMREPMAPALDQFDLDEHFAKEDLRLAQLTNKCANGEDDLEYYIAESGEILGVMADLPFGHRSAKHILYHIFKQIVDFKKADGGKSSLNEIDSNMMDINQFGEANITTAYEYDGDNRGEVEATPVPIHIAHVDLAPMKMAGMGKVGNLAALDPNMRIGGRDIVEIEAKGHK